MKQRFSKRTRLVSALLTLAMVFTFLPFSAFAEGTEGVTINDTNFPDPNFRAYVMAKIDTDHNNSLSDTERNKVTEIDVSGGYNGKKITNLKGIESFPNLKTLWCPVNQLSSLDVSKNEKLADLWCSQNKLTSLDVSKNPELKELWCYDNQLSSLDVRQNTALKVLSCFKNQLTELDVRQNAQLEVLQCGENNLTSLNVSQNIALKKLDCNTNPLTSLDVSKNTKLEVLGCYENQLTSLDVSQTAVTTLKAGDNQIDIYVEETPRTFDLSKLPGKFEVSKASGWVGGTVSGSTLTVNEGATEVIYAYNCGNGRSETFTLNVNVVPDGTVIPPAGGGSTGGGSTGGGSTGGTTPGGPAGGETGGGSTGGSSGGGGGGGGAIIVVAGAAAVGLVGYGVYNYVAERQLQALLPEGAASPENRAQTALLLWNTAGRPEPAAQPAFPDVADPDTAKAAQWCVEHGLMNLKFRGRFAPDGSSPAYKTLNAYRQLVG